MISTVELSEAFAAVGARVRLSPIGLDFRVRRGESGIEVAVARDDKGPFFDVRVNYTRVVALHVAEVDPKERYVILAADDWGDDVEAPARMFRCGLAPGGWYVEPFVADPGV